MDREFQTTASAITGGLLFMLESVLAALEARDVISRRDFYKVLRSNAEKYDDEGAREFVLKAIDVWESHLTSGKTDVWSPIVIEGGKDDDVDANEHVGLTGWKKREGLLGGLTAREHEVLEQLLEGLTNNEIGQALGIKEVTVKLHLRSVYRKIGAKNRAQAVKIVLTQRWRQ